MLCKIFCHVTEIVHVNIINVPLKEVMMKDVNRSKSFYSKNFL